MKWMILAGALALGACSTGERYTAIASLCHTYAVAVKTAARLNTDGKLSLSAQNAIDGTTAPAKAACSGDAPNDDPEAARKVSDAIIAVLEASK